MPSQITELRVAYICSYLTTPSSDDLKWRQEDYDANKMVKALKGDPIKGFFEINVGGTKRRFDQSNVHEFLELVPNALTRLLEEKWPKQATLVPIPNSLVTSSEAADFRTYRLAKEISKRSDGRLSVVPALVFSVPQEKSRTGGSRNPYHFENAYRIAEPVRGPVVLLDDVCTTGSHMIGACWKLQSQGDVEIVLGCAFGSSTKARVDSAISHAERSLDLTKSRFGFWPG